MSSTTSPKLPPVERVSYFDATGRAEAVRLTLAIGGNTTFEDDRFAWSDWGERKKTTRWGLIPEATVAGRTYGQTHAILRYAGKTAGMYPSSDALAALAVDEMLGVLEDLFSQTVVPYFVVRRPTDVLLVVEANIPGIARHPSTQGLTTRAHPCTHRAHCACR